MKEIEMLWKAWYGNEKLIINVPSYWNTEVVSLPEKKPISEEEIKKIICSPIGTLPLKEAVKGKKTVCIAIDDLTKPTEGYKLAPPIIDELISGGIKQSDIYFIMSLGTHRPLVLEDFRKKLGKDIVENFRIYNHNPYEKNNITYLGNTSRGTPVNINKLFLDADYKIGIGMLMPHNLAGFSGGGKIVFPGLASIDSVEENHRATLRGLQGKIGSLSGNQVREDIDEAAKMAGLNFIVNSTHNTQGETVDIFAGDLVLAYKEGASAAIKYYSCKLRYNNDIGIFNAFPRDNWFLLSLNSLNVWSTRDPDKAIVKPGGCMVVINNCSEGVGEHGLMTKGMRHYVMRDKHGTFKGPLEGRRIIFFSPNINKINISDYYSKEVELYKKWDDVLAALKNYESGAKAAIFTSGTLQMDSNVAKG